MSSFQKWSDSALPSVRDALLALADAGPIDTAALRESPHLAGPLPIEVLQISGKDRVRFLHAMLSNDVVLLDKAGPGHGVRATLNSLQGRLVADTHLYLVDGEKKAGHILALFERGAATPFIEMLDRYVIAEKVYFEPDPREALAVVGSGAESAVLAAGLPVPEPGEHTFSSGTLGEHEVLVIRRELGAEQGLILLTAPQAVAAVTAALGLPTASLSSLEALRIEAALPRPGGDLTTLNIVLEGGLKDRAVSFTKGCYIGQEVICRLDSIGTPAKLLVQLEGDHPAPPGTELFRDGKNVGYVTSAVTSAARGKTLFLGYVKKRSNDLGTALHLGAVDGETATVSAHV